MMATMSTTMSDTEIQQEVMLELRWDSRVEATDVGVEVHDGVVTLTGTVDSYVKMLAAAEAAHRVAGVLDVANDLTIKLPGFGARTDTEIAQAVRQALEWDPLVPDKHIQSTVGTAGSRSRGRLTAGHSGRTPRMPSVTSGACLA